MPTKGWTKASNYSVTFFVSLDLLTRCLCGARASLQGAASAGRLLQAAGHECGGDGCRNDVITGGDI